MQLSSMGCLADNAKEQQKREGRDPLAERGRLVVGAKRACDCEKAGTHWLNVGASWSVPRARTRCLADNAKEHERARRLGPTG